ncbi:MAG TPA: lipase maturation factor family protein, partial [Vicinamibacteria bacterium]|nr:lipase maturation factor family protein [Vicinamibacteria bacterium]
LLAAGPFEDRPPRAVRARYYRYELTRLGEPTRAWWKRKVVSEYLPALTRDDPRLLEFLRQEGLR